ncbi:DUF302 domain-containing protein [Aquabacterium sp. A08]|uniref:DUF302 domain-containing protein n=1 Tax=Aquabacterium sp. A08 TaxID=2718532 RepID=UPI001422FFD7|nr:DUF302 domain-containing protein [Aquabacterium sp. A08]NIC41394.1 DUF302 domain-containing protein [Aquabacterium sp. A08]NIC41441.1 DUF302 domain-containing protein [Aquabacterium sp. A08]
MQTWKRLALATATTLVLGATSGCGTLGTIGKLEDGAAAEAGRMWDRWVDGQGDIAVATTWERKVKAGVSASDIADILKQVAVERNMRDVGVLPLSKELEARSGQPEKHLTVYSYCSPLTARKMVDFSPHMAAYLPCRISVVERDDGLWLYTLNMDMMVKMGRKLPSPLKEEAMAVRDTIHEMMERASQGAF